MPKTDRELAEDTYVALVLLLGKKLDKESPTTRGIRRVSGDPFIDALNLIARSREAILSRR
jgi:hypothetical protein